MFLKLLEIQGFKSFPEKIRLDFQKGITAIVGPNGSGKSNVSDAIRWVIGEQSAKSLRGDKMEDIIFAGTKNRKSLSFAEVSITLDNSDKKLNIDFDEVCITRKVYRSGDSSYYINGASCRLKDIQELFMDTGIGKEGYSIIGQGKIDAILSNKSDDRRALFEEAAGIVKFKNRKTQAENKLNEARQNLTRTNDIINEIEKQLEPLKIQAEKTQKYLKLSEQLKYTRINLFIHQYNNATKEIENLQININEILTQYANVKNDIESFTSMQNELKNKLVKIEQNLEKLNLSSKDITYFINENETKISLNLQNIEFLKKEIERITKEAESNSTNIDYTQDRLKALGLSLKSQEIGLSHKTESEKKLLLELENINHILTQNKSNIDKYNFQISQNLTTLNNLKEKILKLELCKTQFDEQNQLYTNNINVLKSSLKERQARKEVLELELENLTSEEAKIKNNILNDESLIIKTNEEITFLNKEKEKLTSEYLFLENRKKVLFQLEKDFEGYNNSVKIILKEMEKGTFEGVCGVVGNIIKVKQKFETAIEISLGSYIQNIIVNTEDNAKKVIEFLKNNNKGRATFLPISSIKPKSLSHNKSNFLKEEGFLGVASDLVDFSTEYTNIISYLLGRIIIFDNLENAINFSNKYKYTYKIVTLTGDIVNTSGALTGGSIFKKESSILSRSREITSIENNLLNIQDKINEINKKQLLNQQEIKKSTAIINEKKENLQNLQIIKAETTTKVNETSEYLFDLQEKLKTQKQDLETSKVKFEENKILLREYTEKSESLVKEISYLKEKLNNFQTDATTHQSFNEEKIKEINNLKIEINSILHEINTSKNEILRLENEVKEFNHKQETFKEQITQNNDNLIKITNENKNILEKIKVLKKDYKEIIDNYDNLQKEKINVNEKIQNYTSKQLHLSTQSSNLQNEKDKFELKKQNIENQIQQISDSIWEDYEITYATACENFFTENQDFDLLKKQEKDIKTQISYLGQVNALAIDEYNSLKERYNLNIIQRDDIIKADKNLTEIISKLMVEMEQQFAEQFKLINENFSLVFSQIFGGGTAKLTLLDKDNILTSGIDIVAQPPGKKLQSLTLLSGGERTLTAVSLLFSILKLKPSPFCILDETEAALDDANVIRYANFIKKFSQENQFIIITHKVGTMEIADILYGITMEEQGVSKLISVKLNEATNL